MNDTADDGDEALFSRSAVGSPFGKLDKEVKTHLDETTYASFLEKCAALGPHGTLPGIVLRELLYRFVHGKTLSQLIAERMAQQLGTEGPIQGREARP